MSVLTLQSLHAEDNTPGEVALGSTTSYLCVPTLAA